MITLTWIMAAILSAPVLMLSYQDTNNIIHDGKCVLTNSRFIIYGSIFSFIIPAFVMSLMYFLTVQRLSQFLKTFNYKSLQKKNDSSSSEKSVSIKTTNNKSTTKNASNFLLNSSKKNNKILSNHQEETQNLNQRNQKEVQTSGRDCNKAETTLETPKKT